MYIPSSFRVNDPPTLYDFVERYPFATLVSVRDGAPFATHLPLLLDRQRGWLLGHVARANPHWQAWPTDGGAALPETESLAIFHGPHAYVSPAWYVESPAVPTWNYAVVHVYGVVRLTPAERTREIVERTVRRFEAPQPQPWTGDLPADYRDKLLAAIVGFEMPIGRIEGKFKLGQNRSAADQAGMHGQLAAGDAEARRLAEFIRERDAATAEN